MTDASIGPDEWPSGCRPLHDAVFAQPFDENSIETLNSFVTPFPGEYDSRKQKKSKVDSEFTGAQVDFSKRCVSMSWLDNLGTPFDDVPEPYLRVLELDPSVAPGRAASEDAVIDWGSEHLCLIQLSFETVRTISCDLANLWNFMAQEMNRRVAAGDVRLFARPHSALAKITHIPPDSWPHFSAVDWIGSIATCPFSNERLYSVRALEPESGAGLALKRPATIEDRMALQAEFSRRVAVGEPPMTAAETEAWANRHGLNREFARETRRAVPDSQKLPRGRSRRYHSPA